MLKVIFIWCFQIHFRYELASKHKRHLAFAGGVTASVLAAPIIASIVVGECYLSLVHCIEEMLSCITTVFILSF